MSKRKNQHILPVEKGWAIKGEGNTRNTVLNRLKKEAMIRGKEIARRQKTELIIHNRDGKITERYSYGNDPYPPKG